MKTHKMSPMMRQKVLLIIMFCVFKYAQACCSLGSNEVSQQDSATTVMAARIDSDDSDCDDYCCSTENKCEKGQGHCEKHEECKSNLRCGEHNCKEGKKLRNENNCCTDICRGWNNCCSKERPCGLGEGNCKTNADCIPTLICGEAGNSCNKTTDFQVNDRCCIRPTTTPTTCKRGYCCEKKPCNLNEGICAAHNQCLGNLLCGRQNCKHKKRGLLSTDRCCRAPTCGTADEDKCEKGWGDCNFKDEECRANMYCVEKAKLIEQKINPSCSTDKKFENIKTCCYPGCFHRNITPPFEDCCTKEKPCKGNQGPCKGDYECVGDSRCLKNCPNGYKKTASCCSNQGHITFEVSKDVPPLEMEGTTPMPREEKLFIVGGQQPTYINESYRRASMTNFTVYEDINENATYKCKQPPDFPNALQNAIIGLLQKRIIVCGGDNSEKRIAFKACYLYINNTWSQTVSLPEEKTSSYFLHTRYGLLIAGGHPVSSKPRQSLELLDINAKWVDLDPNFFPTAHWGGCACDITEQEVAFLNGYNGSYYYFGDYQIPKTSNAPIQYISDIFMSYSFTAHKSSTHEPSKLGRLYPGCGNINNKIYLIGGYTEYYKFAPPEGLFIEVFDLDDLNRNGQWTKLMNMFGSKPDHLQWWNFFTTVKRNYLSMDRSLDYMLIFDGQSTEVFDQVLIKFDGHANFSLMRYREPGNIRIHTSAMLISVENLKTCKEIIKNNKV